MVIPLGDISGGNEESDRIVRGNACQCIIDGNCRFKCISVFIVSYTEFSVVF